MQTSQVFLVVVLFVSICCANGILQAHAEWSVLTKPFHVFPGEKADLLVEIQNSGTLRWLNAKIEVRSLTNSRLFLERHVVHHEEGEVHPGTEARFLIPIPSSTQIGLHHMEILLIHNNDELIQRFVRAVEVDCDDGRFCNGLERYVNGQCVSGPYPCDDGFSCTSDQCSERNGGQCKWELGPNCPSCTGDGCTPDCDGRECGTDGCDGRCGSCASGFGCLDGACVSALVDGTCASPLDLISDPNFNFNGELLVRGDTTTGLNEVVPSCNFLSDAPEKVYQFTIPSGRTVGLEARVHAAGERSDEEYDTVLEIRTKCSDVTSVLDCSDDATPPGFLGSRVNALLTAGTYYLIVDGYSVENFGPFELELKFKPDCMPLCDGAYCGSDQCSGTCGTCSSNEICTSLGRCQPDPCIPDCEGKACGADGCGGQCGVCTGDFLCVDATNTCEEFFPCDHYLPECLSGCASNEYCGSDCACHAVNEKLPDLIVNDKTLLVFEFTQEQFSETSCSVFEGCIKDTGMRRLMRMTIDSPNQGLADFDPPDPKTRPDLFEYSECHAHYHFMGYALIDLLHKSRDEVIMEGSKLGFCMEDSSQYSLGPAFACSASHDCGKQGIQAGWSDVYGSSLDCNWIDITDIAPGTYRLRVALNQLRRLNEASFNNNEAIVTVVIPPLDDSSQTSNTSNNHSSDNSSDDSSDDSSSSSTGHVLLPCLILVASLLFLL